MLSVAYFLISVVCFLACGSTGKHTRLTNATLLISVRRQWRFVKFQHALHKWSVSSLPMPEFDQMILVELDVPCMRLKKKNVQSLVSQPTVWPCERPQIFEWTRWPHSTGPKSLTGAYCHTQNVSIHWVPTARKPGVSTLKYFSNTLEIIICLSNRLTIWLESNARFAGCAYDSWPQTSNLKTAKCCSFHSLDLLFRLHSVNFPLLQWPALGNSQSSNSKSLSLQIGLSNGESPCKAARHSSHTLREATRALLSTLFSNLNCHNFTFDQNLIYHVWFFNSIQFYLSSDLQETPSWTPSLKGSHRLVSRQRQPLETVVYRALSLNACYPILLAFRVYAEMFTVIIQDLYPYTNVSRKILHNFNLIRIRIASIVRRANLYEVAFLILFIFLVLWTSRSAQDEKLGIIDTYRISKLSFLMSRYEWRNLFESFRILPNLSKVN